MITKLTKFFKELSEKLSYQHWLILAGIISILLGALVFFSLNKPETPQAEPIATVTVVAAAQDIAPKTFIKESMLTTIEVPSHLVPEGAVTDMKEIIDKPAKVAIMRNDIVTTRKVFMDISMAGFTGNIPPDCRAVTIGINDITGMAGFAKPGDFVDVMLISKSDTHVSGRIVLQNVQLLAINQNGDVPANTDSDASNGDAVKMPGQSSSSSSGSASSQGKASDKLATATLALTPEDALKLVTDAQDGTLYLVLRPYKPRDKFTTETSYSHFSVDKATNVPQRSTAPMPNAPSPAPAPAASAPAPAPASSGGIEVIRGTTATREGA
ncbi:MAG: Flp pilus assembly protein CpaB [Selenomonadaceae bacterium]|nr:Flp pilus assembly protein CpaB [Selenomonadaceae bacterium]